jgi:hypothetical protein
MLAGWRSLSRPSRSRYQSGSLRRSRSTSRMNAHCSGSLDCLQASKSSTISADVPPRTTPVLADHGAMRDNLAAVWPNGQGRFSPLSISVIGRLPAWNGSPYGEYALWTARGRYSPASSASANLLQCRPGFGLVSNLVIGGEQSGVDRVIMGANQVPEQTLNRVRWMP